MTTVAFADARGPALERVSRLIAERTPFEFSHGYAGYALSTGRLPDDWRRVFEARRNLIDYAVVHYATPVAWHDTEAGWIVPDERYSVPTSKLQGKIRSALRLAGIDFQE